jgi:hypothetical protein
VTGLGRSGPGRGPRGSEERRVRPEGGNGPGKESAREGERERGSWVGPRRRFGLPSFIPSPSFSFSLL